MRIHILGDSIAKLYGIKAILQEQFEASLELIGGAQLTRPEIDAVVVAADLSVVENIMALKNVSKELKEIRKRVFLVEEKSRLGTVQAHALGATHVLAYPVSKTQLLAKLVDHHLAPWSDDSSSRRGQRSRHDRRNVHSLDVQGRDERRTYRRGICWSCRCKDRRQYRRGRPLLLARYRTTAP
jgi:hypothetical protein